MTENKEEMTFEKAFARLEEILEKMNTGALSLEESLKLYEEADGLIHLCQKQLTEAERRIEILVKNRQGELMVGKEGKPKTQDFIPPPGT